MAAAGVMGSLVQLVLDLFEPEPPKPARPVLPKPTTLRPQGPFVPGAPLPEVLPPAAFVHPRATHRIQLGRTQIDYAFHRTKRRTIGMVVGPDGLEVRAPRWVSQADVVQALQEKADWIERKLLEMGERQQQLGAVKMVWRDGVQVDYLGAPIQVVLDSSAALKKGSVQLESQAILRVGLPVTADPVQIREAVQAWLMKQAKQLFVQRLNEFAPKLAVQWRRLSVSSAQTRWGSASADGSIRLNWRLIHHKLDVIDYVVVHELSHLREMNHSPRFWATVQSVMPDYAQHKRVLREQTLAPWD